MFAPQIAQPANADRYKAQEWARVAQGPAAAAEFQKIIDHSGIEVTGPCWGAHLGPARARVLSGDSAGARTACQDFFALSKDADAEVPMLKNAKAEYAKLQ